MGGWLSSTLRALSSRCFGGMGDLLNSSSNRSIDHILDGNVILELDGLSQADKTFFVQACLLYLHHKKMAENVRERFDRCILIEEAHHILSGQRTSLTGSESVIDTTYREIREFGVSLVLLDQMPSKLSGFALTNSYATICMSMSNRADINAMTQTLLLDSGKDILGTLDVGQAVVKFHGRIPRPFLISIPEFNIKKGRVTDEQIGRYMKDKIYEFVAEDREAEVSATEEEGATEDTTGDSSGGSEIAFLQDVAKWTADHAQLLRTRKTALEAEGFTVYAEDQNSFTQVGEIGIEVSGKPDIVAIRGEEICVEDCKTGSPRHSDHFQVLIYMLALPHVEGPWKGRKLKGRLVYGSSLVDVSSSKIDDQLKDLFRKTILRIGGEEPPVKMPSWGECRYCDISSANCPERMKTEPKAIGNHGLF